MRNLLYTTKWIIVLPKKYKKIWYIESSWTQRINTWIKLTDQDSVELEFRVKDKWALYWVYTTSSSDMSTALYCNVDWYIYTGSNSKLVVETEVLPNRLCHTVHYLDGVFYFDWTGSSYSSRNPFKNVANCQIFTRYYNGAYWYNATARIAYFKIRRNGVLLLDLVPVQDQTTNEYWMYDMAHWWFYGNVWTGDLMWWEDIFEWRDGKPFGEY